jgi:hypothetical protein
MVDLRSADPLDPDAYSMILRKTAENLIKADTGEERSFRA